MPDTAQILAALSDMSKNTTAGFTKVYDKIDERFDDCDKRVVSLETEREVKRALCDKKKETRDYWKVTIRMVSVAGIISLVALAWEKIKAVLDLVP